MEEIEYLDEYEDLLKSDGILSIYKNPEVGDSSQNEADNQYIDSFLEEEYVSNDQEYVSSSRKEISGRPTFSSSKDRSIDMSRIHREEDYDVDDRTSENPEIYNEIMKDREEFKSNREKWLKTLTNIGGPDKRIKIISNRPQPKPQSPLIQRKIIPGVKPQNQKTLLVRKVLKNPIQRLEDPLNVKSSFDDPLHALWRPISRPVSRPVSRPAIRSVPKPQTVSEERMKKQSPDLHGKSSLRRYSAEFLDPEDDDHDTIKEIEETLKYFEGETDEKPKPKPQVPAQSSQSGVKRGITVIKRKLNDVDPDRRKIIRLSPQGNMHKSPMQRPLTSAKSMDSLNVLSRMDSKPITKIEIRNNTLNRSLIKLKLNPGNKPLIRLSDTLKNPRKPERISLKLSDTDCGVIKHRRKTTTELELSSHRKIEEHKNYVPLRNDQQDIKNISKINEQVKRVQIIRRPPVRAKSVQPEDTIPRKKVEKEVVVRPKIEKEIVVRPKIEKEIVTRPKIEKEIVTRPKIEKEVITRPKMEKEVIAKPKVQKEILVKPKGQKEIVLKPRVEKEVVLKPRVEKEVVLKPRVEKEVVLKPRVEKEVTVKRNVMELKGKKFKNKKVPKLPPTIRCSIRLDRNAVKKWLQAHKVESSLPSPKVLLKRRGRGAKQNLKPSSIEKNDDDSAVKTARTNDSTEKLAESAVSEAQNASTSKRKTALRDESPTPIIKQPQVSLHSGRKIRATAKATPIVTSTPINKANTRNKKDWSIASTINETPTEKLSQQPLLTVSTPSQINASLEKRVAIKNNLLEKKQTDNSKDVEVVPIDVQTTKSGIMNLKQTIESIKSQLKESASSTSKVDEGKATTPVNYQNVAVYGNTTVRSVKKPHIDIIDLPSTLFVETKFVRRSDKQSNAVIPVPTPTQVNVPKPPQIEAVASGQKQVVEIAQPITQVLPMLEEIDMLIGDKVTKEVQKQLRIISEGFSWQKYVEEQKLKAKANRMEKLNCIKISVNTASEMLNCLKIFLANDDTEEETSSPTIASMAVATPSIAESNLILPDSTMNQSNALDISPSPIGLTESNSIGAVTPNAPLQTSPNELRFKKIKIPYVPPESRAKAASTNSTTTVSRSTNAITKTKEMRKTPSTLHPSADVQPIIVNNVSSSEVIVPEPTSSVLQVSPTPTEVILPSTQDSDGSTIAL